jgi:hypothetical protein
MASHGHRPLKALLASLVATFNALLAPVSGDVRRRLCVTTQGHHPTSLCREEDDRLVTSSVRGGDVA